MIQRIQTIYIFVAILLLLSICFWTIDTFANSQGIFELRWDGVYDVTKADSTLSLVEMPSLMVLIIVPIVLNVCSIFLFKNRKLQMRMVGIACGIEIGLIAILVYVSYNICGLLDANFHLSIRWLAPLAAAVMDFLAYRRISDDEALIKSLDRLR